MPYGPNHIKKFLFFVTLNQKFPRLESLLLKPEKLLKIATILFETFAIYLLTYFFLY
jgi:hypothetical protein